MRVTWLLKTGTGFTSGFLRIGRQYSCVLNVVAIVVVVVAVVVAAAFHLMVCG